MCLSGKGFPLSLGTEPTTGRLLYCTPHERLLPGTGDPIQDDPGHLEVRVEPLAPQDEGCNGSGSHGHVGYDDHGTLKDSTQFRGAATPLQIQAVEKSPVALDNRDLRTRGAGRERIQDLRGGHEKGVQVVTGAAGGKGKPSRVYEIGPLLENRHPTSHCIPGSGEAQGKDGLSRSPFQGGNGQTRL
jgi:hypothetical protein